MIKKTACMIGLFLITQFSFSKSWSAKASVGLLRDTNVFESYDRQVEDGLGRLWFDAAAAVRPVNPLRLWMEYSGGIDVYAGQAVEDRVVHTLTGSAELPLRGKTAFGVDLQGKAKSFMRVDRNYATARVSPYLRVNLFDRALFKASWTVSKFAFSPGNAFDYSARSADAAVESSPLPRVKWSLGFALHELRFKRQAVKWVFPDYGISPWIPLGFSQKDKVAEFSASVEVYYWAYWLIRCSYERNRSNNYGYSYRDPEFELVFAKMLPWRLNVKLFLTQRAKTYSDPLTPFLRIRPDAEDENTSQTLLDVSRPMNKRLTARFRLARYRNESPFRNLYYRKDIASLGFCYEF
jgi:hypothetical protein